MGAEAAAGVEVEGLLADADAEAIASASNFFRSVSSLISHTMDCVPFPTCQKTHKIQMSRYIEAQAYHGEDQYRKSRRGGFHVLDARVQLITVLNT